MKSFFSGLLIYVVITMVFIPLTYVIIKLSIGFYFMAIMGLLF